MKIIPSIIDYISLVVIETDRNMNYSTKHLTIPVLKIGAGTDNWRAGLIHFCPEK